MMNTIVTTDQTDHKISHRQHIYHVIKSKHESIKTDQIEPILKGKINKASQITQEEQEQFILPNS